jgi:ABC-type sugar transport system substrate-binding protein
MLAWASPDLVEYSVNAGKAGAKKVNCVGPVALSQSGLADIENLVVDSFVEGFLEVCSDTEILPVVAVGSGDDAKGIAVSAALLQANPDVTVAFTSTSDGARWWALAAQESGIDKGKIAIIGMDGTRANLDLVASGDVWMLVGQPIFEQAYYLVGLLTQNLMGYPVPYDNLLPSPQITLENVDDFYVIVDLADAVGAK